MSPPSTAEKSKEKAKYLTLEEFLNLPEGDITYELQAGQAIAKISPKSLTVFAPETPPMTYQADQPIQDELFPQLIFTVNELFRKAKV